MFCMASIWKMYSLPRRAGRRCSSRRAEDGEADAGPLQQLGHRLGDLLVLVVEGPGATDPVQGTRRSSSEPSDDVDPLEVLGPVAALGLVHAPGVARSSPWPGTRCPTRSGSRTHQRQVATHVEDLVEDLDVDRQFSSRRHDVHDQISSVVIRSNSRSADTVISASTDRGRDRVAGGGHDLAGLEHDLAGSSGLRWRAPGTRGAPAAHRAGVGVQATASR